MSSRPLSCKLLGYRHTSKATAFIVNLQLHEHCESVLRCRCPDILLVFCGNMGLCQGTLCMSYVLSIVSLHKKSRNNRNFLIFFVCFGWLFSFSLWCEQRSNQIPEIMWTMSSTRSILKHSVWSPCLSFRNRSLYTIEFAIAKVPSVTPWIASTEGTWENI